MPNKCKCGGELVIADHTYPIVQIYFEARCNKCGVLRRQRKRLPKKRTKSPDQYPARLLKEREESRQNGDALARTVVDYLDGKVGREELSFGLRRYCQNENSFVIGHARAAAFLKGTAQ